MAHITLTVEFDPFDYGEAKARYFIKQELIAGLHSAASRDYGRETGMFWTRDVPTEEVDEDAINAGLSV